MIPGMRLSRREPSINSASCNHPAKRYRCQAHTSKA
jgi:hypothetical protein